MYNKVEALQIAYAMHMKGGLDNLVDPESGKTVGFGLSVPKLLGGFGGDREAIWREMLKNLDAKLKNEPSPYSAERLSELTDAAVLATDITTAAKSLGIKGTETAQPATEQPKESVEQKTTEESKTKSEPAPPIVEEENKKKPTFLTRTSEFLGFGEGGLYGNLTKDRNATSGILTSPQNILIAFIVAIANLFSGGRAVAPESKSDIDVTPTQPPTSQQEQTPQEVSIGHLKPTPTPTQLATTRALDNGRFA